MKYKYFSLLAILFFLFTHFSLAEKGMSDAQNNEKVFNIVTVHIVGKTNIKGDANHSPETPPKGKLPEGGGLVIKGPDEDGTWKMVSFIFEPSQIVVFEGDQVKLNFIGTQGSSHKIKVEGHNEIIDLKRGEIESVSLTADEPGIIEYSSIEKQPTMNGQIVVLPKSK